MQALGFSINLLTLFALVLAIGIVVDNTIVVVEAVHVKMTEDHMGPMDATIAAMKEITGAIIAITLVMSASVPAGGISLWSGRCILSSVFSYAGYIYSHLGYQCINTYTSIMRLNAATSGTGQKERITCPILLRFQQSIRFYSKQISGTHHENCRQANGYDGFADRVFCGWGASAILPSDLYLRKIRDLFM